MAATAVLFACAALYMRCRWFAGQGTRRHSFTFEEILILFYYPGIILLVSTHVSHAYYLLSLQGGTATTSDILWALAGPATTFTVATIATAMSIQHSRKTRKVDLFALKQGVDPGPQIAELIRLRSARVSTFFPSRSISASAQAEATSAFHYSALTPRWRPAVFLKSVAKAPVDMLQLTLLVAFSGGWWWLLGAAIGHSSWPLWTLGATLLGAITLSGLWLLTSASVEYFQRLNWRRRTRELFVVMAEDDAYSDERKRQSSAFAQHVALEAIAALRESFVAGPQHQQPCVKRLLVRFTRRAQ